MEFRKATKKKTKMRGAFYGPSGSGKTYSCLRVATGLCRAENNGVIPDEGEPGRIFLIDSEEGDSELYAKLFDFSVGILEDKTIDGYMAAIKAAAAARPSVLVIDSLSHAWRELLESVDNAKRGRSGNSNTFSAWADATPKQKEFVAAIKKFPGHVLATMRAETVWDLVTNNDGRKEPKRMGLKPEQGKNIEYEFTFLVQIDTDHSARVEKDRTGKFQDHAYKELTETFGESLAAWLADGAKPVTAEQKDQMRELCKGARLNGAAFLALVGKTPGSWEEAEEAIAKLRAIDPVEAAQKELTKKLGEATAGQVEPAPSTPTTSTPTSASTAKAGSGNGKGEGAPDSGSASSTEGAPRETSTAVMLAYKRDLDAVTTTADLAKVIAAWAERVGALSRRPQMIATGYAAGRLSQINGVELTGEEARVHSALNDMAKE